MKKIKEFLTAIKLLDNQEAKEILENISNYTCEFNDNKDLVITLYLKRGLRFGLIEKFNYFNSYLNGVVVVLKVNLDQISRELIKIYVHSFFKEIKNELLIKDWDKTKFIVDKNCLTIFYNIENIKSEYIKNSKNLINYLRDKIQVYIEDIKFNFDDSGIQLLKEKELEHLEDVKRIKEELESQKKEAKQQSSMVKYTSRFEPNLKDEPVPIESLTPEDKIAVIQGEVFSIKKNQLRTGSVIYLIGITDYTSSIVVKQFSKVDANKDLETWKVGDCIKMKIGLETNTFENRYQLIGQLKNYTKIANASKPKRVDNHLDKRVELCLHSKMTAFDGLIAPDELINRLKEFNHTAFAITDRYNVQMYPEVMKVCSKNNIKPLYGIEFEKLPDLIPAVLNEKHIPLLNSRYIVFDLETTGLYAQHEDIIEFGAVVYEDNMVIEHKQFFIKPNKPINNRITELTNITEKDVEDAVDQKTGLEVIVDYIKDDILVAHNGINFDFNFLNTKLEQYGLKKLTNPIIDTMVISRAINGEYKSNTLEYICNKNKVVYDRQDAHRADYDAKVLTEVWDVFISRLKELNCSYVDEINNVIQNESLKNRTRGNFVLAYAKNQKGIRDLYELVSLSHTKQFFDRPILFESDLLRFKENLLIANSPIESDVWTDALSANSEILKETVEKYDFITVTPVDGFNHELKAHNINISETQKTIKRIIDTAIKCKKLPVAVSNAYYLDPNDVQYHDVYIHIPVLNRRKHRFYKYRCGPIAYVRTTDEMIEEFSFLEDQDLIEKLVVDNSNKIAKMIDDNIEPLKKKLYPPFIEGVNDKVKETVYLNARKKYGENLPEIVEKQLKKELDSIIGNGYAVVYWISHLLVEKSINDGYVVGSRGSVGSSLVATFLNITDVNALPPHYLCNNCHYSDFNVDKNEYEDGYDLDYKPCPKCGTMMGGEGHQIPFETFLGFNGDKVPDIDLNFSGVYQNKAHNFIKEMFGEDKAFRAGTIGTVAEKTAFGNVKTYFEEINKEFNNAEIERYAIKCQDVKRTTGQHPGGIVVVPNDMSIYDFTPYNYPADDKTQDWYTTHFAFEYIHDNLLKFDILGHDNPTALRMLKDLTGVDEKDIPNHDERTMSLFSSLNALNITADDLLGETTGAISLPEFGTKFVRQMLKDTNPKSFADLIRISGLSHGTDVWLGNAKDIIESGKTLKDVIGCRDDIMVYLINHGIEPLLSFQVMEDVRKGKNIKPEAQQILRNNKIPEWYIESCNKIKYMFPKAHATAYVMHAWKFAWYKLNYPLEYYATYFSIRSQVFNVKIITDGYESIKNEYQRINKLLNNQVTKKNVSNKEQDLIPIYETALEMFARGYSIKMIDLEKSLVSEFVIDKQEKAIYCPFTSLDGLGEQVAVSIIEARKEAPFVSVEDLIKRTKVGKQHIQALREYGVFNKLSESNQMSLFDVM